MMPNSSHCALIPQRLPSNALIETAPLGNLRAPVGHMRWGASDKNLAFSVKLADRRSQADLNEAEAADACA
jgi:hypothetical protein